MKVIMSITNIKIGCYIQIRRLNSIFQNRLSNLQEQLEKSLFCEIFICEILMVSHLTLTLYRLLLYETLSVLLELPLSLLFIPHTDCPHSCTVTWNCRLTINSRWTTSNAKRFILWYFLYSVLTIPEPEQPKYSF